jgi:hypothetical protein
MNAPPSLAFTAGSPRIPLPFLLVGVVFLAGGLAAFPFAASLLVDGFYHPEVLAVVHAITLGFVLVVFVGASIQLLPVLTGMPVARTKLARAGGVLTLLGVPAMLGGFAAVSWPVVAGGGFAVLAGIALFVAALAPLLAAVRKDPVLLGFALAFGALLLNAVVGLLLAFDRHHILFSGAPTDRLAAHVHLGLLGVFTVAIFAVESKLLPMFLLGPVPAPRRVRVTLISLSAGALLLASALAFRFTILPGAALVAAAFVLQVGSLASVLGGRKRKEIDAGFLYALSAHADLALALLVGLAFASGAGAGTPLAFRLPVLYGFLLLGGWLLQAVVGFLSKILPFLVWQVVYAPRVGLGPVPTLKNLSPDGPQLLGFALFRVALLGVAAALLWGRPAPLSAAAAFFSLSLVPFFVHAARVAAHLVHPRTFAVKEVPVAVAR